MKTRIRPIAFAFAVVFAVSSFAPSRAQQPATRPEAPKQDPDKVMKSLEQVLKAYQDENTALRARVKELEAEVQKLKQSRTVTLLPGQPQAKVPDGWVPREFNGMTYYVVPLDGSRSGAGAGATRPEHGTFVVPAEPAPTK